MFYFTEKNPAFYIQLKGMNAGKPMKEKITNSIGISPDENIFIPEFFYYLILNLFNSGKFSSRLKGSAVPYIRKSDITAVIIEFLITGNYE